MIKNEKLYRFLLQAFPIEWKEFLGKLRRYNLKGDASPVPHCIIARVDGTTFHGGLCDRWKGIVSLYAFCKVNQRKFCIDYTFPFDLQLLTIPNQYDWLIPPTAICHNLFNVHMMRLAGDSTLKRMQKLPTEKQIHCYANRDWLPIINQTYHSQFKWGELFHELFKPSPYLEQRIAEKRASLPSAYIAIAFRMQNLLGDYPEYQYAPASLNRQKEIVEACKTFVVSLRERSNKNILITSDSERLTKEFENMKGIYINTGSAAHVDTQSNAPLEQYSKSFVDFYLLSDAEKIYSVGTKEMYDSDFPRYAAKLNERPFERIVL